MSWTLRKLFTAWCGPKDKVVDLDLLFQPFYKLLILFGLLPYGIKFNKAKRNYKIVQNSLYYNMVTTVCVSLFCSTFLVWHVQELYASSDTDSFQAVFLTSLNYILELVLFLLICIVSFVKAFVDRHCYVDILNNIAEIWKEFPFHRDSMILNNLRSHTKFVMVGGFYIIILVHLVIHATRDDGFIKILLVLVTFVLTETIHYVIIGFIRVLVLLAAATLENVRERMQTLSEIKQSSQTVWRIEPNSIKASLREMERIYAKVFQMTKKINHCFQGIILLFAIQCFHSMLSEGYVIYHGLAVGLSMTTHEIINCSAWILFQVMKVHVLAHTGQLLKNEAQRIGQTLLDIPTEGQDLTTLMEIQHFSSKIKHQKIQLSVFGYFSLDATFLYNNVAAAMMYLTILAQFNSGDKNND